MEFRVLGPLEVDGLALGGRRQRVLLAMLLLHANTVVSRDRLIDAIWGDTPPASASHTLDAYASRLRKLLGDRLETRAPGYRLRVEADELDLARFEALVAAARDAADPVPMLREADALWRGRVLEDLEYAPFARPHVERLEEMRQRAIEDRVDAEPSPDVAELERRVGEYPLRERTRAQLMLALYRAGRQTRALAVYREGAALLREELGLAPGPALRELEAAILRHDPVLRAGAALRVRLRPRSRRHWPVALAGFALAPIVALALVLAGPRGSPIVITLPDRAAAAVAGAGSLWVAQPDSRTVARIEPRSRTIRQTIAVGSMPSALAVGGGAVWAANALDGTVSRIDPGTNAVVQTVRVGGGPGALAVARGEVWVADALGTTLTRLDARTGRPRGTVRLDVAPSALATGAGALWVASTRANTVLKLDLATGRVLARAHVGVAPHALAIAGGGLWVANQLDGTVVRLEPATLALTDTVATGGDPGSLLAVAGELWIATSTRMFRVDLRTRRIASERPGGGELAAFGGRVVVLRPAPDASHRGGTLTLLNPARAFGTLDPAVQLEVNPNQLLGLTNDGLVAFDHTGGADGMHVVPDLAATLPEPESTTYRFTLRPGIRYSTGRAVQPRDFRYAIERLFRLDSPTAGFYRGIAGAGACSPRRCDLTRGIVTDARHVVFHLRAPDPDFLMKLALPYAYAVPDGSAPREAIRRPLPATGPYEIAGYDHRELRLVRNPMFREWSKQAQPQGYPDTIVWRLGIGLDDALTAIEEGRADWVLNYGPLPRARRDEIATRYASQVHRNQLPAVYYYFLNTRVPPFDDVRVRRAVNFALDRAALARRLDATPACSVVPPQAPGFRRACPYTRHPEAGRWSAPDLARARRLIAASHTRGMRVRVAGDAATPDLDAIVALLRRLGYRAAPRIIPAGRDYGNTISDSRNRVQIGGGGWTIDYPGAADFFDAKFSCHAFRPADPLSNSDSEFCDPRLDAEADRARAADPRHAGEAWARVYGKVVDQAPWLPMVTPTWVDFVSRRVGNYRFHPLWGLMVDQLWVRGTR